ncbi:hypothetical protein [Vibrio tapetis]|uniref:Uncharacterized protein n=1 Tax=Vibrio tapetis subsp. tapetis TaxID=1671868 RepID=A0A2N8ZAM3_9VIBR|nr:hypothetical protein [Vibrio tapetis]SON48970.1 conserved membrane protein of unknown function [Vibrio tapetis subsp. tapetis]
MTRSFDTAKKEAVFIVLPLLVLFLIKMLNNELMSFLKLSDFSLATSIMYGQLLAKTLDVPDKNKKRDRFSTYQVYIFVVSILSMAMYIGFQLIPDINFNFYIAQIVTFLAGIVFYIPLSTLMSDLSKE